MIKRNTPLTFRLHDSVYQYEGGNIPTSVVAADLKRVEYSETEGFQCWFDDNKYPVNGFFDPHAQFAADPVKKYLRNWLRSIAQNPLLWPAVLLPGFRKDWVNDFGELCRISLGGYTYEPQYYTRAVKEIYKCLNGFNRNIKDAICIILEQDRPYRYRLQDIMALLDKDALQANPRKEVNRIMDTLTTRDPNRDWSKISKLISFGMLFPMSKRLARTFGKRLDPITIALDTTDLYNCLLSDAQRGEDRYHYLGLDDEGMTKLHMAINV